MPGRGERARAAEPSVGLALPGCLDRDAGRSTIDARSRDANRMAYYKCMVCRRVEPTPNYSRCSKEATCGFSTNRWTEVSDDEGYAAIISRRKSNYVFAILFVVVLFSAYVFVPPFRIAADNVLILLKNIFRNISDRLASGR